MEKKEKENQTESDSAGLWPEPTWYGHQGPSTIFTFTSHKYSPGSKDSQNKEINEPGRVLEVHCVQFGMIYNFYIVKSFGHKRNQ